MDAARRKELIERYREGYDAIVESLRDITPAELTAREGPDEWSPQQIVNHVADSEMTSAIRLRKLVAEDRPVIYGYDEGRFAERLHYDRPYEASLLAVKGARDSSLTLLEALTEVEWAREGWHTESGPYSVELWLEIYAQHCHDHADQIRRARAAAR